MVRLSFTRVRETWTSMGLTKSGFYNAVADGVMTRPMKISARAAAIPDHERDAIAAARLAGHTDEQMRNLVNELHAARPRWFEQASATLLVPTPT